MAKKVKKSKIHTGRRGGRYRLVGGRKVYIKRRATTAVRKRVRKQAKAKPRDPVAARPVCAAPILAPPSILPPASTSASGSIVTVMDDWDTDAVVSPQGHHYYFIATQFHGDYKNERLTFTDRKLDKLIGTNEKWRIFMAAYYGIRANSRDLVKKVMRRTYAVVSKLHPAFRNVDNYDRAAMGLTYNYAREIGVTENIRSWDSTTLEDFKDGNF
jgi:hypothetical protein